MYKSSGTIIWKQGKAKAKAKTTTPVCLKNNGLIENNWRIRK